MILCTNCFNILRLKNGKYHCELCRCRDKLKMQLFIDCYVTQEDVSPASTYIVTIGEMVEIVSYLSKYFERIHITSETLGQAPMRVTVDGDKIIIDGEVFELP